jgi:hypothetical protein
MACKLNHRAYGPKRFRRDLAARCSGEILYSPKLRRGMRELRAALEAVAIRLASAYRADARPAPSRMSESAGCLA